MPTTSTTVQEPRVLFLSGDLMVGRGIDQILPRPSDPILFEPYVKNALDYVALAEQVNGPIPRPVDLAYIWGDALDALERAAPAVRIVNLETSVTTCEKPWPKGINYRMNPENIGCLSEGKIDCCLLANNHVLDWGRGGLIETLHTLRHAGIASAGAGRNHEEAAAPAILPLGEDSRLLVFSGGVADSGIPEEWRAEGERSGVNLLHDLGNPTVERIARQVRDLKSKRDIALYSIHWGGNWGYDVPHEQRRFAHRLIDDAGIDVVHGHSSHHPKGIEVYRDKAILYGAGDLLNDYEGIGGYEAFRGDLALLYLLRIDTSTAELLAWELIPMQVRRFQLCYPPLSHCLWLRDTLNRESRIFNTQVEMGDERTLRVSR